MTIDDVWPQGTLIRNRTSANVVGAGPDSGTPCFITQSNGLSATVGVQSNSVLEEAGVPGEVHDAGRVARSDPSFDADAELPWIGEGVVREVAATAPDLLSARELLVVEQTLSKLDPRFGER